MSDGQISSGVRVHSTTLFDTPGRSHRWEIDPRPPRTVVPDTRSSLCCPDPSGTSVDRGLCPFEGWSLKGSRSTLTGPQGSTLTGLLGPTLTGPQGSVPTGVCTDGYIWVDTGTETSGPGST